MRMHRVLRGLMVIVAALAVTAPAAPADPPSVDPSTLQPPPPPDARCDPTGRYVICHTVIDFSVEAEPVTDLGLPCGTIYVTATDVRHGLRFYENGLLVRRHVTAPGGVSGFNSLSPTGEGPRVEVVGHLNWWSTFSVPGDEDTESTTAPASTSGSSRPTAESSRSSPAEPIPKKSTPESRASSKTRRSPKRSAPPSRPDDHAAPRRRSPADTRRAPASGCGRDARTERRSVTLPHSG